jgi:hypothetical protein
MVIATSLVGSSFGQYQAYPSTSQYGTYPPQQAQQPWWNSVRPQQNLTSQPAPVPHGYSPSEVPNVNLSAYARSHQQQGPVNQGTAPYQPAARTYNALPTSFGVQQQYPVVGGTPLSEPTQQATPSLHPDSYYDQPVPSYSEQQPDYGFDPNVAGCSTLLAPGVRAGWYGRALGMIMSRDRGDNLWLSYDIADIRERVLNSHDADFDSAGGSGASIGHFFNCGQNSIELVYWGIYPDRSEANALWSDTAAGLNTILHFDNLEYDAGAGAQDLRGTYFFDAERHRLRRDYNVYNVELNLLGHNFASGCGPWQLGWTAGVRYFRFDEDFLYSSDPIDTSFTGAAEEVHYNIDVENNLIGFQVGGRADYCLSRCLSLFADTKVGIYGNHISHRSSIYGANGQAFVADPLSPYFGQDVDIASSKDDFAMIGDLSIGANLCLGPCWSVNAGYRAVAVNGVALTTSQVPVDFIGALDSIRAVDSSGSLILHGAFLGVDYCY